MIKKPLNFWTSLFTQDMDKQARQVELLVVIVLFILLFVAGLFWQYKIEISVPKDGKRVIIAKMNIYELLISKKKGVK